MTLVEKLQEVVKADDKIEATHAARNSGVIVHGSLWRMVYAARENADRALWGTHADERAAAAREILAALEEAYRRGYEEGLNDGATK